MVQELVHLHDWFAGVSRSGSSDTRASSNLPHWPVPPSGFPASRGPASDDLSTSLSASEQTLSFIPFQTVRARWCTQSMRSAVGQYLLFLIDKRPRIVSPTSRQSFSRPGSTLYPPILCQESLALFLSSRPTRPHPTLASHRARSPAYSLYR